MLRGVLFDVDGTLVDSNDAHAKAWVEALHEAGHDVPFARVRPLIGMGGDKLLPEVAGVSEEDPEGKRIAERRSAIFRERHLPGLRPFPGARELVQRLRTAGLRLAVATSARPEEVKPLLTIAGVENLLEVGASSGDASDSKPDPDIVHAALRRVDLPPSEVVMIGDTPYDVEEAARAGVVTIAFRCGGWDDEALIGALAVYDGPADLLARLDRSPLRMPALV